MLIEKCIEMKIKFSLARRNCVITVRLPFSWTYFSNRDAYQTQRSTDFPERRTSVTHHLAVVIERARVVPAGEFE
jgi:hypothetical protein